MRGLKISLCLAVLLCLPLVAAAADLIFFADDSYKALGAPALSAAPLNPVLASGEEGILRISLSNAGQIEELIPLPANSTPEDIALEMKEELSCVDAQNLSARLEGDGLLRVASGPQHLPNLTSGSVALLEFNVAVPADARGWHELFLHLDYERQVDVSAKDGLISPLYQPDNLTIPLKVLVEDSGGPLRIAGIKSEIWPGERGRILAAIENRGQQTLRNCTASLVTAPPFSGGETDMALGDINPGNIKVAELFLQSEKSASPGEYQLACAVNFEQGQVLLPFSVQMESRSGISWLILPAVVLIGLAGAGAILATRRKPKRSMRRRKLWPW